MPKYSYKCENCNHQFVIFHGIQENPSNCPECESSDDLTKMVNMVYIKKTPTEKTNSSFKKVGELTKEAIEDNKEILKDIKEQTKNLNYVDITNISD
tara:strand:+ start:595 stop:885 length:291 start_codon:yes stop_codon:yes gene_type:complete